jgi:ketosteroid isomerase-like protein
MPIPAPEVERVVREWLVAKQGADADGIRAALSTYDGVLAIGTDADEWWSGSKAFVAAHTSGAAFAADLQSVEAHRDGPIAWAAIRAVIQTGDPGGWPVRLTLVLAQNDAGEWRVVQSHASTPSAD